MHTTKARNPLTTIFRALLATKRRVLVLTAIAVFAIAVSAFAYWTAETGAGGAGASSATSVTEGPPPALTPQDGRKIDVSWTASTLANGHAVSGYTVHRYAAPTDAPAATLGGDCTDTISG